MSCVTGLRDLFDVVIHSVLRSVTFGTHLNVCKINAQQLLVFSVTPFKIDQNQNQNDH